MAKGVADKIYRELKSKPIEILAVVLGLASTAIITYNTIIAMQERKKNEDLAHLNREIIILQHKKLKKELEQNQ